MLRDKTDFENICYYLVGKLIPSALQNTQDIQNSNYANCSIQSIFREGHKLPLFLKQTTQVINWIQEHETHYFSCSFTSDLAL